VGPTRLHPLPHLTGGSHPPTLPLPHPLAPPDRWVPPTYLPHLTGGSHLPYPTPTPPNRWVPPTPPDRWVPPPTVQEKYMAKDATRGFELGTSPCPGSIQSSLPLHPRKLYVDIWVWPFIFTVKSVGLGFTTSFLLFFYVWLHRNGPTAQRLIGSV
jgi:hypothetical protein